MENYLYRQDRPLNALLSFTTPTEKIVNQQLTHRKRNVSSTSDQTISPRSAGRSELLVMCCVTPLLSLPSRRPQGSANEGSPARVRVSVAWSYGNEGQQIENNARRGAAGPGSAHDLYACAVRQSGAGESWRAGVVIIALLAYPSTPAVDRVSRRLRYCKR